MRSFLCGRLCFFVLFLLCLPQRGESVTHRFAAFDLWPNLSENRYFFTAGSQNLFQSQAHFGLSNTFAYHPLRQRLVSNGETRSIVDYYLAHFVSADIGITDFWQVGFVWPVFSLAKFASPSADSAEPRYVSRAGDLRLDMKMRLLDEDLKSLGMALTHFVIIPLGADDVYLGEGSLAGGFKIIGEYSLHPRIHMALNLGIKFQKERVILNNIDFQHLFIGNIGFSSEMTKKWGVVIEAQATTPFTHFFSNGETTPVEIIGGLQRRIGKSGVTVSAGVEGCVSCGVRGALPQVFFNLEFCKIDSLKQRLLNIPPHGVDSHRKK